MPVLNNSMCYNRAVPRSKSLEGTTLYKQNLPLEVIYSGGRGWRQLPSCPPGGYDPVYRLWYILYCMWDGACRVPNRNTAVYSIGEYYRTG